MSPREVVQFIKEKDVKIIDLRFIDLPGLWQHFSVTPHEIEEDTFEDGLGFDGSSIRGFQSIHESDMLLVPDASTARLDPFTEVTTLVMICNVQDPVKDEAYSRDPRNIARKAEKHLKSTGIADIAYFGPEAEFFIFDGVSFDQSYQHGYYHIDSEAGFWNSGEEFPNQGYRPRYKQGYFPTPPLDHYQDIRSEMVLTMEGLGIPIEVHHQEVASGGQAEIDMRFNTLTAMADSLMWYKYVVKQVAWKHGKTATFMPKPIFQDNGSGMHIHQSLWKGKRNLFYEKGHYADISQMCKWYIGGLLKHAPALLGFVAPTTNSYRRLVPGYEAPINLVYSQRNRSAAIRIPLVSKSERGKRLEFRVPDASSNPYLAFSACLMAGLDGIRNKIDPGPPVDKDIYELEESEAKKIRKLPGTLADVLSALEADHDFLLKGDVFTKDLLEIYIEYKRKNEVDAIRLRPHPYEFALYFDV